MILQEQGEGARTSSVYFQQHEPYIAAHVSARHTATRRIESIWATKDTSSPVHRLVGKLLCTAPLMAMGDTGQTGQCTHPFGNEPSAGNRMYSD